MLEELAAYWTDHPGWECEEEAKGVEEADSRKAITPSRDGDDQTTKGLKQREQGQRQQQQQQQQSNTNVFSFLEEPLGKIGRVIIRVGKLNGIGNGSGDGAPAIPGVKFMPALSMHWMTN